MDTKLTLSLDKKVIERAKKYARSKNTSLSKLIEAYLTKTSSPEKEQYELSPLVKSLSGIAREPADFNHRKEYADHLAKKYKS